MIFKINVYHSACIFQIIIYSGMFKVSVKFINSVGHNAKKSYFSFPNLSS